MSRLVFTPLAEADLKAILEYIAIDRPSTAINVATRIRERCLLLASQPLIGQLRPDFSSDYRSFPVERWVIFYRMRNDAVEIHRILDGCPGHRSLDRLIREVFSS